MAIVEVSRLDAEMGMPKPISRASISKIDAMLFQSFVKLIPLDILVAKEARLLIRETPRLKKKPDAVHLASAMRWNIPVMHTYDNDDLTHLSNKLKCRNGALLEICYPKTDDAGELFVERA